MLPVRYFVADRHIVKGIIVKHALLAIAAALIMAGIVPIATRADTLYSGMEAVTAKSTPCVAGGQHISIPAGSQLLVLMDTDDHRKTEVMIESGKVAGTCWLYPTRYSFLTNMKCDGLNPRTMGAAERTVCAPLMQVAQPITMQAEDSAIIVHRVYCDAGRRYILPTGTPIWSQRGTQLGRTEVFVGRDQLLECRILNLKQGDIKIVHHDSNPNPEAPASPDT